MRNLIDVSLWPPRCYVGGRRIHHFWLGVALIIHDSRDYKVWVSDLKRRLP